MQRKISLHGEASQGALISASVLRDLLDVILEGSRRSIRLRCEGRSASRGQSPGWLESAAAFHVSGFADGSTEVLIETRSLLEAAPEYFGLIDIFDAKEHQPSALDLFVDGLADAAEGNTESDYFDTALLKTYGKLERVLSRGFDSIGFDGRRGFTVGRDQLRTIRGLKATVPAPRQVRISGTLEQIRHSDRRFTLLLDEGIVTGVADDAISRDLLAEHFGRSVVMSGEAEFRPSGRLLRLEAHHIEAASENASIWSRIPRPLLQTTTKVEQHHVEQGPRSGLAAILGRWPGDETDAELEAALERIS